MANKNTSLSIVINAKDNTSAALGRTRAGLESISGQLDAMRSRLQSTAAGLIAFGQIKALADMADQVQSVNARLKLASATMQEFAAAQRESYAIARESGHTWPGKCDRIPDKCAGY